MKITNLDHMVLTVSDFKKSYNFYHNILNLEFIETNNGSYNFKAGNTLIKLRLQDNDSNSIVAAHLATGVYDFCLETSTSLKKSFKN